MTTPHPHRHLLDAALDAVLHGWHVLPLRPGTKRPALHGQTRCPRTGACARGHLTWEQRATSDPDRIHAAWSHGPYNIGIATGPSGLLVINLDVPKHGTGGPDGAARFRELCEHAGQPVPDTYQVTTPSGGMHLYFRVPDGVRLPSTVGALAPLVDTRAWGGYVVAPGSITPEGIYQGRFHDRLPAVLPDWLLTLLKPEPTQSPQPPRPVRTLHLPTGNSNSSRAALAALDAECTAVASAPEGRRNTTLNRAAFKIGRFIAWGDLPRHVIEQAFQEAGEAAGLPPAECTATIRSALDASLRTARPQEAA